MNVIALSDNGKLAVLFREPQDGLKQRKYTALHYRTYDKDKNKEKFWMIKGSDSFAFDAIPADEAGYVYVTFGTGDYLVCRLLGLRYLCFGSDNAVSKNLPHVAAIKKIISAGHRHGVVLRVIADNDVSGAKTVTALAAHGFSVEAFDWDSAITAVDTTGCDLRGLTEFFYKKGFTLDDVYDFVTDDQFYLQRIAA